MSGKVCLRMKQSRAVDRAKPQKVQSSPHAPARSLQSTSASTPPNTLRATRTPTILATPQLPTIYQSLDATLLRDSIDPIYTTRSQQATSQTPLRRAPAGASTNTMPDVCPRYHHTDSCISQDPPTNMQSQVKRTVKLVTEQHAKYIPHHALSPLSHRQH